MKFSERYGYVKPAEVLKRGGLNEEAITALCNCYDHLAKWLNQYDVNNGNHYDESYTSLEETTWCFFMNHRRQDFYRDRGHMVAATQFLQDSNNEWYTKFDLIEFSIRVLRKNIGRDVDLQRIFISFVKILNATFKRLDYGYRVVDD